MKLTGAQALIKSLEAETQAEPTEWEAAPESTNRGETL
jgi:hypothetical protein